MQSWSKGHTHQPQPGQYLTHAHSHGQLFRPYWGSLSWHNCQVNKRGKLVSQRPFNAEVTPLSSNQLHITHVGAVGWQPHFNSPTTCMGKVDHKLSWTMREEMKARSTHTPTQVLASPSWREVNRRMDRQILKIFLPGFRIQSEILTDFRILQLQWIANSSIFWAWILDFACNKSIFSPDFRIRRNFNGRFS